MSVDLRVLGGRAKGARDEEEGGERFGVGEVEYSGDESQWLWLAVIGEGDTHC